jgi:hypothetical protein
MATNVNFVPYTARSFKERIKTARSIKFAQPQIVHEKRRVVMLLFNNLRICLYENIVLGYPRIAYPLTRYSYPFTGWTAAVLGNIIGIRSSVGWA